MPLLKSILEEQSRGELSLSDYPSVTPLPASEMNTTKSSGAASSARKRGENSRFKSTKDRRATTGPTHFVGGRCLAFVVGGACYPELRVAREVMESESKEIILGSTGLLTAEDFLEDLSRLAEENRR